MTAVEPPRLPREIPDWHADAACRRFPQLDFIEARGVEQTAARMVCAGCPVRMACAVGALERGEPYGMWGGLDRQDRKRLALKYGYPVPADLPEHGVRSRYAKHGCRCHDCTAAHAVYEAGRRARAEEKRRRAELWAVPIAVEVSCRYGRRWVDAGQLVLPLPGVPAPRAPEPPSDIPPMLTLVA